MSGIDYNKMMDLYAEIDDALAPIWEDNPELAPPIYTWAEGGILCVTWIVLRMEDVAEELAVMDIMDAFEDVDWENVTPLDIGVGTWRLAVSGTTQSGIELSILSSLDRVPGWTRPASPEDNFLHNYCQCQQQQAHNRNWAMAFCGYVRLPGMPEPARDAPHCPKCMELDAAGYECERCEATTPNNPASSPSAAF